MGGQQQQHLHIGTGPKQGHQHMAQTEKVVDTCLGDQQQQHLHNSHGRKPDSGMWHTLKMPFCNSELLPDKQTNINMSIATAMGE
jgi:hypothetical protein